MAYERVNAAPEGAQPGGACAGAAAGRAGSSPRRWPGGSPRRRASTSAPSRAAARTAASSPATSQAAKAAGATKAPAPQAAAEAPKAAAPAPKAAPAGGAPAGLTADQVQGFFAKDAYEEVPHDGMRKTIARRLTEAKQDVPHFYLTVDCELDALMKLRETINGSPARTRTASRPSSSRSTTSSSRRWPSR